MKNPSEKGKLWEKRRRDRLKESFHKLAQLLPHYDPAKIPAQNEILEKATQFVKELRTSNSRLLLQQTQTDEKTKLIQELQDEVNRLILRVKQLTSLLTQAKISIPTGPSIKSLGKRKLKWSEKLSSESPESKKQRVEATKIPEEPTAETQETSSEKENESPQQSPSSSVKPVQNPEPPPPPIQIPMTFTLPVQTAPTFILAPHTLTPIVQAGPMANRMAIPAPRILPKPNNSSQIPKLPLVRITQPIPKFKKTRQRKKKSEVVQNIAPKVIPKETAAKSTNTDLPEIKNTVITEIEPICESGLREEDLPEEPDHPVVSIIDISSPSPSISETINPDSVIVPEKEAKESAAVTSEIIIPNPEPSESIDRVSGEVNAEVRNYDQEEPVSSGVEKLAEEFKCNITPSTEQHLESPNRCSEDHLKRILIDDSQLDKHSQENFALATKPTYLGGCSLTGSSVNEEGSLTARLEIEESKIAGQVGLENVAHQQKGVPTVEDKRSCNEDVVDENQTKARSSPVIGNDPCMERSLVTENTPVVTQPVVISENNKVADNHQMVQASLLAKNSSDDRSVLVENWTPDKQLPVDEPKLLQKSQLPNQTTATSGTLLTSNRQVGTSLIQNIIADESLAHEVTATSSLTQNNPAVFPLVQQNVAISFTQENISTSLSAQPNIAVSSTAQPNSGSRYVSRQIIDAPSITQNNSVVSSSAQPNTVLSSSAQPNTVVSSSAQPNSVSRYINQNIDTPPLVQNNSVVSSTAQPNTVTSSSAQPNSVSRYITHHNIDAPPLAQNNSVVSSSAQLNPVSTSSIHSVTHCNAHQVPKVSPLIQKNTVASSSIHSASHYTARQTASASPLAQKITVASSSTQPNTVSHYTTHQNTVATSLSQQNPVLTSLAQQNIVTPSLGQQNIVNPSLGQQSVAHTFGQTEVATSLAQPNTVVPSFAQQPHTAVTSLAHESRVAHSSATPNAVSRLFTQQNTTVPSLAQNRAVIASLAHQNITAPTLAKCNKISTSIPQQNSVVTSLAVSATSTHSLHSIAMIEASHTVPAELPQPSTQRPEAMLEQVNLHESFQDIADLISQPARPKQTELREESLTTDKISECIARSIDLIDQPEAELMELGTDWGETHSPKSPISPTQMFLSMFPLLPRESIISSSESQQTPHKQSYSAGKSSFYIDSMLPDEHSSSNDTFRHVRDLPGHSSQNNILSSNSLNIGNLMTSNIETTCLQTVPMNNFSLNILSSENENLENSNPFNFNLTPISRCSTFNMSEPLENRQNKSTKTKSDIDFSVFSPYNLINTPVSTQNYQLPPSSGSKDHNWAPFQYTNAPHVPPPKIVSSVNDFQIPNSKPPPPTSIQSNPTFFRPITDFPETPTDNRKSSQKQPDTTYKPYAQVQTKPPSTLNDNVQNFPSSRVTSNFSQDNLFRPMVTPTTNIRTNAFPEGNASTTSNKTSRRSKNAPKAQSTARSTKNDYNSNFNTGATGKANKKNADLFTSYTPQLTFAQQNDAQIVAPPADSNPKSKNYRNNSTNSSATTPHATVNSRSADTSKRSRANQHTSTTVPNDPGNFMVRNDFYENMLPQNPPNQFLTHNKAQRQPFYLPEVPLQNLDFTMQNTLPTHPVIASEKPLNRSQSASSKYNYFGTQCVAQYPPTEPNYSNLGQSSLQQVPQATTKKTSSAQQPYQQIPQQVQRSHANLSHHGLASNNPQPSRPVNWMTDPPSNVCTRTKPDAPNPFSVSKLVGNSNSSGNTANTNYCVEGLIRKSSNNDWNDFNYGVPTHHDPGHQGGQPGSQHFMPYQTTHQHAEQYTYPNFHHQSYNFGNTQFGHFDNSHPVQNIHQQRGHHQPQSLPGPSIDTSLGGLHHASSNHATRGHGTMPSSGQVAPSLGLSGVPASIHGSSLSSSHNNTAPAGHIPSSSHAIGTSSGHRSVSSSHASATSSHTNLSSGHGSAPSGHGNLSSGHTSGSSGHGNLSSGHISGSSSHVSGTSGHGNVSSGHGSGTPGHGNVSSGHGSISSGHANVSSGHANVSSGHANVSSVHGSVLSGHGNVSSTHGSSSSGQVHRSLSSGHGNVTSGHIGISGNHTATSTSVHGLSSGHMNLPPSGHASHTSSHSSQSHGSSVLNFNLSSIFPEMNDKRSSNSGSNSNSNICSGYYNNSKSNAK